jgi:homoprotocatechuate degradation regulator HpaR
LEYFETPLQPKCFEVALKNANGDPVFLQTALMRDFKHSLPMELLKAREATMARFRPMLRRHGLTEQQWRVIRALADCKKISTGELARRSFLLAPSLTRIVQHLEERNIIRRSSDNQDQRRSTFALSAKGRRLFAEVAPDSEALYAEIEEEFGSSRFDELHRLLAEFTDTLLRRSCEDKQCNPTM